jgi:hypothetical protein
MFFLLTALLAVHGSIHLLGFLKPWRLAQVPALTGRTLIALSERGAHIAGLLWLTACLFFWAAAALRLARQDSWWTAALAGVVLSQGLVVFHWADAKAGSIPNFVILVAAVAAAATTRFERRAGEEVRALVALSSRAATLEPAMAKDLDNLPSPIRRWLERSGAAARTRPHAVRLRQRGEIRTSADGAWMPATAEQHFSVNPPGFVWRIETTMAKIVPIVGRDKYADGKGHMLIAAAGLVKVVDATGHEIDQGSMLRFLAEIMWFPSAALAPYIEWKAIDETNAEATMRYAGVTASATFSFDETGRMTGISARRYMGSWGSAKLELWVGTIRSWKVFQGIEVPNAGSVVWKLASGDFDYYRWEVLDIEYDAEHTPGLPGHES